MFLSVCSQGWPFGVRRSVGPLCPREDHLSLSSFPRLPPVLCVGLRPCGLFPSSLMCSPVSSLLCSCLGGHVSGNSWGLLLTFLGDPISQQTPRSSGSFHLFFYNVPWALGVAVVLGSIAAFWLVVDPVMVSTCCKGRLPCWGMTTTLLCSLRTSILRVVRDHIGLVKWWL